MAFAVAAAKRQGMAGDRGNGVAASDLREVRASERLRAAPPRPLVVDLDHTLVRTDTLVESIVWILFHAPFRLFAVLAALPAGRAAFKAAVARAARLDCASLPYDEEILALIRDRRTAGGEVHLVTAAHESIAAGVAAHLGLFDRVIGTAGDDNVKGARKAARIAAAIAGPYAYIGDSRSDVPVWAAAEERLIVSRRPDFVARIGREGIVPAAVLARPGGGPRAWVSALRLHQWPKNAILLAPLALSQQIGNPRAALTALAAFLLFGLVASATYIVNDLADLAADRVHATKRHRAFAAGRLSPLDGLAAAAALMAAGLGLAFALHAGFGLYLAGYVGLTLLYSFRLKREPLVDVLVIGGLFSLRILAGMAVLDQPISLWLTSFTMMLFTGLAMAKRHAEVIRAARTGRALPGRDYEPGDAPITAAIGVGAGVASTLVMLLYMQFEASLTGLYVRTGPLFVMPVVLASWLMRIWSRAQRGNLHDDPVIFALKDGVSWGHAAAIAILWVAAAY
ncbi:UbiA family prenyltransferase [Sphingomonas profundi]|uniref:UbiA family prenyltransferase n=1 Tax=Alterirhizorhabdus profundi TaxID=2681549 RepID=UPI0012E92923|nr:UbiA family prenyltransferase [Sphingomonas profundi]